MTRAQALAGGLTGRAIDWKLQRGLWVRIHSGVYLTVPGRDDWETRSVAALLRAGSGAALHRRAAGFVWGLVRSAPSPIEVVIPASRRVDPVEGIVIRRSRLLSARVHPTEWPHRIRAEHTVLDLAAGAGFDRLVDLTTKALDLGIATPEYDEWELIVEIDGRLGHTGWRARQREGRRDRKAATTGRLTVRCHWVDLVPTACELAADLALILTRRGWRGRPRACGPGCTVGSASAA